MNKEKKFNVLYTENYSKVFRLCKGYFGGDTNTAEDVTQEVFTKIWQHLKDFRGDSKIETWIYRITVNTCLMTIRKNKKLKTQLTSDIPETADKQHDSTHETQLKKLYRELEKVSKEDKVIILMLLEGVSYEKISEVIGTSEDTLRVKIHRVKKKLTEKLATS